VSHVPSVSRVMSGSTSDGKLAVIGDLSHARVERSVTPYIGSGEGYHGSEPAVIPDGVSQEVTHYLGVLGMMISRRPNNRASSEKAPGPRQMTAAAITVAKAAVSLVSNTSTAGAANQEHMLPRPASTATMAAKRVK